MDKFTAELDRCNKCGFCQSACPTFRVTGFEWLVTRGRVSLAQDLVAGSISIDDPSLTEAMDSCLVCGGCMEACPPQIQIHEVVYTARQERVKKFGLSLLQKVVLRGLLPHPGLLGAAAKAGHLAEKLRLRRLGARVLPGSLGRAAATGPSLPGTTARQLIGRPAPVQAPRARVAYFVACTKEFLYPRAAQATVAVLRHNGVEVIIPESVCCGLPCMSAGDLEGARNLAIKNISYLKNLAVDAIICDEGSCAAHIADYPELLAGTPYEADAIAVAARFTEFSSFLADLEPLPFTTPLGVTVTWHDPCAMRNYLKITQQPRRLIRSVPGVTYVEAKDAGMCCGGAGAVMITQPELSDAILKIKTEGIRATGADYVITSSPSCIMQLERGGSRVLYLSEFLAMAYGLEETPRCR